MSSKNRLTYVAAGVAAVVLAFGAYAIGSSNSSGSGTADASQATARNGEGPPDGRGPGDLGTRVTGATAAKVKAAVLAKYKGTIEQVVKLPDGSYVAHVITSKGEYHVAVSKDFEITGAQQGAPGDGRGVPHGFGTPVTGAAAAKAKAAALAKYPGTVEGVFRLADGSYVVHVLRSSGEVHVRVSKDFVVTGTETGMPGGGPAGPPPGATQQ
jgi:hypothetical protein